MGIKNFQKWIRENHDNVISEVNDNNNKLDYIYFDLNFCLHNCIYNTKTESTLIKKLISMINNILNKFHVNNVIFVADGTAPLAKLMLQRKRRLIMMRNLDNSNKLTPLSLTAGTIFMDNLNQSLNKYIINLNKRNINVISHISNNGESEYKIMNDIKDRFNINKDKIFGILSNDSDIVVMSCFSPAYNNIRILYKDGPVRIINIKKFSKNLNTQFKNNINIDKHHLINDDITNRDFAFISLLLGNDYLPKLNYVSLDRLLNCYINTLSKFNYGLFNNDLTINVHSMSHFMMNISLDMDNTNKGWNKKFKLSKINFNMYSNYIEGLLWCMDTYLHCKCRRNDYMYQFDENIYSLGIYYYLKLNYNIIYPFENNYFVPKHINALLLIPSSYIHLIHKKYQKTIEVNFPKLYEEEKCNICINFHKNISNLNQAKVFVNFDDPNEKLTFNNQLNLLTKEYTEHKKIHKELSKDDIDLIINFLKD